MVAQVTVATLVTGFNAVAREAAIAAQLQAGIPVALILEGLPTGNSVLDHLSIGTSHQIARIAPGCLCCTGNLTMRVTLNRMLRSRPARLYIGLATSDHLASIRAFLSGAPYNNLLQLTQDLHA